MNSLPFVNWNNAVEREAILAEIKSLTPEQKNEMRVQASNWWSFMLSFDSVLRTQEMDTLKASLLADRSQGLKSQAETIREFRAKTGLGLREAAEALYPGSTTSTSSSHTGSPR